MMRKIILGEDFNFYIQNGDEEDKCNKLPSEWKNREEIKVLQKKLKDILRSVTKNEVTTIYVEGLNTPAQQQEYTMTLKSLRNAIKENLPFFKGIFIDETSETIGASKTNVDYLPRAVRKQTKE
jgi:uncharacterized protein YqfB (UPF0267 family)